MPTDKEAQHLSSIPPVLSVVIPVLNRPRELDAALNELAEQSHQRHPGEVEVVVVDDGSYPPIKLFQPPGLTVKILRNERRLGANAARELGLAAAQGRFVNFHDSDDGFDKYWLEAVIEALSSSSCPPDVLVTRRWIESGGLRKARRQRWFESNYEQSRLIRRMLTLRNCLGPFGGVIFSKTILENVSFPHAASSQDWLLYLKIFNKQLTAGISTRARFIYRLDGHDRISANAQAKVRGMFAIIRATRNDKPFGRAIRFYQLNRFSRWIKACNRHNLSKACHRALFARTFWSGIALVYAAIALRLR